MIPEPAKPRPFWPVFSPPGVAAQPPLSHTAPCAPSAAPQVFPGEEFRVALQEARAIGANVSPGPACAGGGVGWALRCGRPQSRRALPIRM